MEQIASHSPHDAVFKHLLSQRATARDFLSIHLPKHLREQCDLRTLQLESGSFIEEDLRASHSDILYSLKTQHGEGYIYILIEHQSSPDRHMAFRLMRYAIAAMQRTLIKGIISCRWLFLCYFITAGSLLTRTRRAGWMISLSQRWPSGCIASVFHW